MFRRLVPVAVAAAGLVLIPSAASATPEPAPVENLFAAGYSGDVQVVLPDGRHAQASLGEFRGAGEDGWHGYLSLSVWSTYDCPWGGVCETGRAYAWTDLADADFDRGLRGASAVDVPMTLESSSWGPGGYETTREDVTVSVVLTGTGEVTRSTDRGELCGDGGRECQSMRLYAERAAAGAVTIDEQSASGTGRLSYGLGVDAAAPKFPAEY